MQTTKEYVFNVFDVHYVPIAFWVCMNSQYDK